jgi:hypothetical protein
MRWVLIIMSALLVLSIFSRLDHYVPGQEDNPALAKAALCGVAEPTHTAVIDHAIGSGLIVSATRPSDRVYVLTVENDLWQEQEVSAQEVLAIAGWCRVAGGDGRAVASVIGIKGKNELAHVVDGEFTVVEPRY